MNTVTQSFSSALSTATYAAINDIIGQVGYWLAAAIPGMSIYSDVYEQPANPTNGKRTILLQYKDSGHKIKVVNETSYKNNYTGYKSGFWFNPLTMANGYWGGGGYDPYYVLFDNVTGTTFQFQVILTSYGFILRYMRQAETVWTPFMFGSTTTDDIGIYQCSVWAVPGTDLPGTLANKYYGAYKNSQGMYVLHPNYITVNSILSKWVVAPLGMTTTSVDNLPASSIVQDSSGVKYFYNGYGLWPVDI